MQSFTQPQRLLELMHERRITHQAIFELAVLIVGQSSDNVVLHPLEIVVGVYHFTCPWMERLAGAAPDLRVPTTSPAWPRMSPIATSVSRSAFQKPRCSSSSLNRFRARKITRLKCSSDNRRSRQICSLSSSSR